MRAPIDKPTTLTAVLLGLLLLFVQQVGYAHALTHVVAPGAPQPVRSDSPHPAEKACTQCVMYAQLGTALTSHVEPPPIVAMGYERAVVALPRSHAPEASPPFLSRAPPR